MNAVKNALILLLILLALVFAVQNPEPVDLRFLLYTDPPLRLPLFVVVFLALLAGIVVTALVQSLGRLRLQRTIRR
ncbi:MAG: LapA family protein, partial [Deltaproteobacteria bacterium]|nr:LapA family protein [Deltaproteobacteria bacterium]